MDNMQKRIQQSIELPGIPTSNGSATGVKREYIIQEALEWIGTPFHDKERKKQIGCDCIGLIIGVAKAFGLEKQTNFVDFKDYGKNPSSKIMREQMKIHLDTINKYYALPGDIFYFSFIGNPQHVGILMPNNMIIHAHEPDGEVVYHRLGMWWAEKIVGAYRYKGIV